MSQLFEIPASAYTPEMDTLGAIPDISIFEGEQVPISHNALTLGTQPLQLLPLPGFEFPVSSAEEQFRDATVRQGTAAFEQLRGAIVGCVTHPQLRDAAVPGQLIWARPVLVDPPPMLQPSGICWTPRCGPESLLLVSAIMPLGFV
ncbi:hypothetical protein JCGZ_15204 [Jatropha curcas]|uniref:Uncharacterized protein n=1 Tax=Jatropha curcas TaxID=180498 RepID=A0A067KI80_JATCU|nr:hypothetical protein JCGZ_15204 [Jatropha curcas]